MSVADAVTAALVAAACCAGSGCASHTAPDGFLPIPEEAPRHAFGGWIDLEVGTGAARERVAGELIAVSEDTVWVLGDDGLRAVGTAAVVDGRLVGYDSQYARVVGATTLGSLSTIANGFALIFTFPMWLIVGSAAARGQSRAPIVDAPPPRWSALAPWARFPQGLPPGLDPGTLEPRR